MPNPNVSQVRLSSWPGSGLGSEKARMAGFPLLVVGTAMLKSGPMAFALVVPRLADFGVWRSAENRLSDTWSSGARRSYASATRSPGEMSSSATPSGPRPYAVARISRLEKGGAEPLPLPRAHVSQALIVVPPRLV